jgi:DNA-binding NarL/FixJ family response regulator
MANRINVMIVEEDPKCQAALTRVVSMAGDMECTAYGRRQEALAAFPASRPDVLLLCLPEPGRGGFGGSGFVREFLSEAPTAAVVVLGSSQDSQAVVECLFAGAFGYLLRSDSWDVICDGIRQVHQGRAAFSPRIAGQVVNVFRRLAEPVPAGNLSDREREIFRLLAKPARNKEIALALNVSVPTVRTHLRTIYLKLGVRSRREAVGKARQSAPLLTPSQTNGHPVRETLRSAPRLFEPRRSPYPGGYPRAAMGA